MEDYEITGVTSGIFIYFIFSNSPYCRHLFITDHQKVCWRVMQQELVPLN